MSRGMLAEAFLKDGSWLKGPDFLTKSKADWPKLSTEPQVPSDSAPEVKKIVVVFATATHENPLTCFIEYFSSWDKLIRCTAWLLRLKRSLRHSSVSAKRDKVLQCVKSVKSEPTDLQLSVQDLTDAEESIVAFVQQQTFRDEVNTLRTGQAVRKSSKLYKLDPILHEGILRVGVRLSPCLH